MTLEEKCPEVQCVLPLLGTIELLLVVLLPGIAFPLLYLESLD
jgi:hypothetical protein